MERRINKTLVQPYELNLHVFMPASIWINLNKFSRNAEQKTAHLDKMYR